MKVLKRIILENKKRVYVWQTADKNWRVCSAQGNHGPFRTLKALRSWANDWHDMCAVQGNSIYCEDVDYAKCGVKRGAK